MTIYLIYNTSTEHKYNLDLSVQNSHLTHCQWPSKVTCVEREWQIHITALLISYCRTFIPSSFLKIPHEGFIAWYVNTYKVKSRQFPINPRESGLEFNNLRRHNVNGIPLLHDLKEHFLHDMLPYHKPARRKKSFFSGTPVVAKLKVIAEFHQEVNGHIKCFYKWKIAFSHGILT